MRIRTLIALCIAGASLTAVAQTHVEGMEYYKADQLDNAKELLLRSLNNQGTDKSVSNFYLGQIALDEGNKTEAKKYFDAGISANPENPYNYVGLGNLDLLNGMVKEAENNFKMAEKHSKKDASLEIAIARAYDNADAVKYAKQISKAVEKARKYDISNADIYIFEGDVEKGKKNIGPAAARYEMAVNNDANATAAYVKYANLFTQVNPDYAIRMLKDLLKVNPQSALGQRELANAYYNKQDFNNAALEYGSYVNNPSHFKKDEDRYAFLLFYGQNYKKGYEYATKLLQENPNNFTAQRYQFMNAAQLPEMADQYLPLAEALYTKHLADPKNNKFAAIDYILIADEFDKAKRVDDAINVMNEAIKDDPTNPAFDKQLAMIYVDANNLSKASDTYETYLTKVEKPSFNDYIQQATFAYYAGVENKDNPEAAAKYYGKAGEYADKAAADRPDHHKPLKIKGDIAKQTATTDQVELAAAPYYEKAIVMLEELPNASSYTSDAKEMYNYMGNYYLDQKDVEKAKVYFNKYLTLDPNNEAYRKFVEGLK